MTAEDPANAAVPDPPRQVRDLRLNVVVFSGGSGTNTIVESLLRHPQLVPIIVINAYDDGHSTGRLRRFIPGMLGPSDVRKNIARLMPSSQDRHKALRFLSDYRLSRGCEFAYGMRIVEAMAGGNAQIFADSVRERFELLSVGQARTFQRYFGSFYRYAVSEDARGNRFDFDDCALGNILFAGCYLEQDRDFNRTVKTFGDFFEIQGRILNVTRGENLFLMARTERGDFIRGEAQLVSMEASSSISDLYLIDEKVYRESIEPADRLPDGELAGYIEAGRRLPEIGEEAREAIASADMIIYGPGTQHSSLLPSYMTRGVAEAIIAHRNVDKVFISNIRRDVDIQQDDAGALARKFILAMSRGEISINRDEVVTHFFFQKAESVPEPAAEPGARQTGNYVPFEGSMLDAPPGSFIVRDWETHDGKHAGGYVMQELRRLIQNRVGATLKSSPYMVSIVVPALNEERTVAETLRLLTSLDFSAYDLGREIIFVDGGSTDGTLQLARAAAGVKVLQLDNCRGRGAALRRGIAEARGDIVVFFPADLEYVEEDVYKLVYPIVHSGFKVVFGTRTVKCIDLSSHLMTIYGGRRIPYLVSKYGGMLLSTATLFLYNRYVTDTLTSLKAFDARTLRSFELESNGMDLDTEITSKACRTGQYILEVPVEYKARTRMQGKKSTTMDGLKALWSLVAWRFAHLP